MEEFNKKNHSSESFEDSEVFKKMHEELKDLVRKSEGKDENLTPEEIKRRDTLYQVLRPDNKMNMN